ncbi:hypothetical protein V866_001193 [Kwoniella sp. B9012]
MIERSQDADDELRDLLPEEAQELRDFLEKRRWFEAKLKSLEDVPPIYPFIHPILTSNDWDSTRPQGFIREKESSSDYRLPTANQIREWQKERDRIEAEVMTFDGGDLERMKEKTRAATLLPLTPPSTHLVSITLDLIVLIDRLLTLLRHRGSLLELTAVRLRWDQIRWQIYLETEKIRHEVAEIVRDKGRWHPVIDPLRSQNCNSQRKQSIQNIDTDQNPIPHTPSPRISSLPERSSASGPSSPKVSSPRLESHKSPKLHTTPKRSLHIPLLHSQLISLNIRQQNLQANEVKRSGALLDRMIDIAGPLSNLGGIDGPVDSAEKKDNEAVPDELLDIQDEVEEKVRDMGDRIAWCKQLEDHWKRSEEHHAASADSLHHAEHLITFLNLLLQQPASSERHREMCDLLENAQKRLPIPINKSFPRPSHQAYPENDQHNEEVVAALTEAYNQAQSSLKTCQIGVERYGRLARSRDVILAQSSTATGIAATLEDATRILSYGDGTAIPPDMDDPLSLSASYGAWAQEVPRWIIRAQRYSEEGITISQKLSLAVARYQNISQQPCHVNDPISVVDDLTEYAGRQSEDLMKLSIAVAAIVKSTQEREEILSASHPFIISVTAIQSSIAALQEKVSSSTRRSAWPTSEAVSADIFKEEVSAISQRLKIEVRVPSQSLFRRFPQAQETFPILRSYLKEQLSDLDQKEQHLHQSIDLLERVTAQAKAIRSAEEDETFLHKKVEAVQQVLAASSPHMDVEFDNLSRQVDELEQEFMEWESTLAGRIPFLANTTGTFHPENGHLGADGMTLVEPSHIRMEELHQPIDKSVVDLAVRKHINMSSLRLASEIDNCKALLRRLKNECWERRCHEAAAHIDTIVSRWQVLREEVEADIARLDQQMDAGVSKESAPRNAAELEERYSSIFFRHQTASRDALEELKSRIKDNPEPDRDTLDGKQWDSTVGPATSAVQTVLSEIDQMQALLKEKSKIRFIPKMRVPVEQIDDIFGPSSSSNLNISGSPVDQPRQLQIELDKLNLESIVNPSSEDLTKTPRLQRLPDTQTAESVDYSVRRISQEAQDVKMDQVNPSSALHDTLAASIAERQLLIPRLHRLARLDTVIKKCDSAHSDLLQAIDADDPDQLEKLVALATSAYKAVTHFSVEINDDKRVIREVKRVSQSWEELQMLMKRSDQPDKVSSRSPSVASYTTHRVNSTTSTASRLPRLVSSVPRATARSTSNPMTDTLPSPFTNSSTALRIRAVSDTPSRYRLSSLKKSAGPPLSKTGSITTPTSSETGTWPRQSSLPRPSRLSMHPGSVTAQRSKVPRDFTKKEYIPNAKSKLDVAIGKVVNRLDVHVPVRPVGLNSADEWKDQSGQYWIGAEGRAKLCFCRILRSRTVMVRVGGGWVELSKFLLDHFADAVNSWQTPFGEAHLTRQSFISASSSNSSLFGSDLPKPITSASLSSQYMGRPVPTSYSHSSLASIASSSSEKTPSNKPIALPNTEENYLSPEKFPRSTSDQNLPSQPHTPNSARKLSTTSPSGPGSPLTAFQFMRKASESPSIREKEKERFHGRRSILGKELPAG